MTAAAPEQAAARSFAAGDRGRGSRKKHIFFPNFLPVLIGSAGDEKFGKSLFVLLACAPTLISFHSARDGEARGKIVVSRMVLSHRGANGAAAIALANSMLCASMRRAVRPGGGFGSIAVAGEFHCQDPGVWVLVHTSPSLRQVFCCAFIGEEHEVA